MSFIVFETDHAQLCGTGKMLCFRLKNLSCVTGNVDLTIALLNEKNYFYLLLLGDKECRGG